MSDKLLMILFLLIATFFWLASFNALAQGIIRIGT